MNAQIYIVSALSDVTTIQAQGRSLPKCTITLQEPGRYGDTVIATLMGEECQQGVLVGDIVLAQLRMSLHEYEGRQYQDITVRAIQKIGSTVKF